MTTPPYTIQPVAGREGRSGEKIEAVASTSDFPMRRPPKIEGYECFFISYFGSKGVIKFTYRRVAA